MKTMKRMLLCSLLLALSASAASASGLSLHWNTCTLGGGTQDATFACDDDFQFFDLVGQFQMPSALNGVTGVEFTLDLASAGTTLPAWWQYNAGECRDSQLGMLTGTPSTFFCPDWAANGSSGGLAAYDEGYFGPNTAHILGGWAVPLAKARNLTTTPNYFLFRLEFTTVGTVAAPVCSGCGVPVCIVFNGAKIVVPPVPGQPDGSVKISAARDPGGNFATWQGGAGTGTILGQSCPAATPTHKSTWGAVKSLYR